jgi:hypothetical protein
VQSAYNCYAADDEHDIFKLYEAISVSELAPAVLRTLAIIRNEVMEEMSAETAKLICAKLDETMTRIRDGAYNGAWDQFILDLPSALDVEAPSPRCKLNHLRDRVVVLVRAVLGPATAGCPFCGAIAGDALAYPCPRRQQRGSPVPHHPEIGSIPCSDLFFVTFIHIPHVRSHSLFIS